MKKIMVILAALFMLTAASVAILKWLSLGPFENTESTETEDMSKKKPKLPTILIEMQTIQFPLVQAGAVGGTAQIQIKLETEGQDNANVLKRILTKIHHAFLSDLYGYLPRILKDNGRIGDHILKQRLKTICERLAGKGIIKSVLVLSQIDNPAK